MWATGPTREGMRDENQGVEDHEIEDEEQDDHNLTDLDVDYDENPGVVDHESEGVGEDGHDAYIDGAKDENQDNLSTESDMVKNVTSAQDSGEENGVQGTPRYNLWKNRVHQYAVHPDMRGHTGATMSMGNGSVFSGSWKQKLVTRSSTESEVVGVYDILPQILWTKKFLEDQGVGIKETVLYQDNMSSMLLERNGRQSSTKRMKHMDIQYFYVGDHIQNKTLSLHHCPTEEMLADYFTKPLQGSLFVRLRNQIMGAHIMGAEFEDGNPKTQRSVLGCEDNHKTTEASERHQRASERDQNGILARDQMCVVSAMRDQNHEKAHNASMAQDQNNENDYKGNTHFGGTKEKQMTYREALLGLDNSELSSDFEIYSVCEALCKCICSVKVILTY